MDGSIIRGYVYEDPAFKRLSANCFGKSLVICHFPQTHQQTANHPELSCRIITRTKSSDHITPILIQLHRLPVQYHIHYKNLLLIYKALHHLAPTYLCNLLHEYSPSRTLRSTSAGLLTIPTPQYHGCPSLQLLGTQTMELSPPTH